MYGKNLMGSYADKISYEERWNVIHYIRSLQAKELKLAYNQLENTLNSVDQPAGADYLAAHMIDLSGGHEVEVEHKDDHHHIEGHGDEKHVEEEHGHEGGHEENHDH